MAQHIDIEKPAYNFSATMATTYNTYSLGAVASLIFLAIENMPPHFLAHVYYGQMAGWIRIPLSTEVGLSLGDTVLDGDPPAPYGKGHSSPCNFRSTALACIPAGPHFTHNPYCQLGSAWRVALEAVLRICKSFARPCKSFTVLRRIRNCQCYYYYYGRPM